MLVLKRKTGEIIQLGDDVRISVRQVQGDRVRLAIAAPDNVPVIHHRLVMGDLQIDEDQIEQERDWTQVIPL